jgi:uroporphyrinogen-III synthase
MRVLVTRPREDAIRTAAKLTALGHEVILDPLFVIEPVPFSLPSTAVAAVAVTSANAIRNAAKDSRFSSYKSLPLFAVGSQTAQIAQEAGFNETIVADGDVHSLAGLLASKLTPGSRLLYLAGENRANDLAALAAPSGIEVETLVVYRAKAVERFTERTAAMLRANNVDVVLHYSPRGSATFVALAEKGKLSAALGSCPHLCLSDAVAKPLIAAGAKVKIAARPDEAALLALLEV